MSSSSTKRKLSSDAEESERPLKISETKKEAKEVKQDFVIRLDEETRKTARDPYDEALLTFCRTGTWTLPCEPMLPYSQDGAEFSVGLPILPERKGGMFTEPSAEYVAVCLDYFLPPEYKAWPAEERVKYDAACAAYFQGKVWSRSEPRPLLHPTVAFIGEGGPVSPIVEYAPSSPSYAPASPSYYPGSPVDEADQKEAKEIKEEDEEKKEQPTLASVIAWLTRSRQSFVPMMEEKKMHRNPADVLVAMLRAVPESTLVDGGHLQWLDEQIEGCNYQAPEEIGRRIMNEWTSMLLSRLGLYPREAWEQTCIDIVLDKIKV